MIRKHPKPVSLLNSNLLLIFIVMIGFYSFLFISTYSANLTGFATANESAILPNETSELNLTNGSLGNVTISSMNTPVNDTNLSGTVTVPTPNFGGATVNETLRQSQVIIRQPVKWTKLVKASGSVKGVSVDLPAEAVNIKVSKIIEGEKEAISTAKIKKNRNAKPIETASPLTGAVAFSSPGAFERIRNLISDMQMSLAGASSFTVEGTSEDGNITLGIEEELEELEIEYETPGPQAFEESTRAGKRIVISSDLSYENVLAFSTIPEGPIQKVKLFHIVDGERSEAEILNFTDEDGNGFRDTIYWVVPHLSNQTYELDLIILNPYEEVSVGNDWIVYFNTTGTAKLNITKDEEAFGVLQFNGLYCGSQLVNVSIQNESVVIYNWSCNNQTASINHTKIIESPYFSQKFEFSEGNGTIVEFAFEPNFTVHNESSGESFTTSTNFQTKLNRTFTISEDGDFLVLSTAQLHGSKTSKSVKTRLLVDNNAVAETIWEPKDKKKTRDYQTFVSHKTLHLNAGNHTFELQWATEHPSSIAYIRDARVTIFNLNESHSVETEAEQDLSESNTTIANLTFAPSSPGNYLVIATGEYKAGSTHVTVFADLLIDNFLKDEARYEAKDETDYKPFAFHNVSFFDSSTHSIAATAREEAASSAKIRRVRITAVRLTPDFDFHTNESNPVSSTSSTGYQNKTILSFQPNETADYLFFATAELSSAKKNTPVSAVLEIDNATVCEHIQEPKETSSPPDLFTFACSKNVTLANSSVHTAVIKFRKVGGSDGVCASDEEDGDHDEDDNEDEENDNGHGDDNHNEDDEEDGHDEDHGGEGNGDEGGHDEDEEDGDEENYCSDFSCGENKVTICHIPPGNPGNPQTLCISEDAVPSHFNNHDDYCGPCETEEQACVSIRNARLTAFKLGKEVPRKIAVINTSSTDAEGAPINLTFEIFDNGNLIFNETSETFSFSIPVGTYDIRLTPVKRPELNQPNVVNVNLFDAEINQNFSLPNFDFPNGIRSEGFSPDSRAVIFNPPENLSFDFAQINFNSTSFGLFKCKNWNFTARECGAGCTLDDEDAGICEVNASWDFVASAVPGEIFTINLTPQDPAFAAYSEGPGENSTTSNAFVNKTILNFIPKNAGEHLIIATAQLHINSKKDSVSARVLVDGENISEVVWEPTDADIASDYQAYGTHILKNFSKTNHTIILQWKSSGGKTSFIKNSRISVIEIDAENSTNENPHPLTTSFVGYTNLSFTPFYTDDYLIIASGEIQDGHCARSATAKLLLNGIDVGNSSYECKDVTDYKPFFFHTVMNLTGNITYNLNLSAKRTTNSGGEIRRARIMVVRMTEDFDVHHASNDSQGTITCNGKCTTPFYNKTVLSFIPNSTGDYLFLATAQFGNRAKKESTRVVLEVDGTEVCDVLQRARKNNNPDRLLFVCQYNKTLDTSLHTALIKYQAFGKKPKSTIQNARITAIRITPPKSIAIGLSSTLAGGVNWHIDNLTKKVDWNATGNNNTGITQYYVVIQAENTDVDSYIASSGDLQRSGGIENITQENQKITNSTADPTIPTAVKRSLTANFSETPIGLSVINGSSIYLKFFLNISGGTGAGSYLNNITIKAIEEGELP